MTHDDKSEEQGSRASSRFSLFYLVLGGVCLLGYFLLAARLDFFVDPDLSYVNHEIGRVPLGEFSTSYLMYFPMAQLGSMLWKLVLLLPGTLFLSLFLSGRLAESGRGEQAPKRRVKPTLGVAVLSLLALGALIVLINFVFHSTYVTDDENAYELQAEILLEGMLYAPPPPDDVSFKNFFVITTGKYTGKYTLGHPIALAVGKALGTAYLMPVVLSVLSVVLTYRIGAMFYGASAGLLGAALLVISPFFLFTSSTLLSHTTSFFALALFTYLFFRSYARNSAVLAFVAGLAAGYAFNVRQLTAIGFCAPFAFVAVASLLKRRRLVTPLLMLAGFLIPFALTLEYNRLISGRYLEFPFHYYSPVERFGFGKMMSGDGYEHTPTRAVVNAAVSAARMNSWLFGFPASLLFVLLLLILKEKREDEEKERIAPRNGLIKSPDAFLFSIIACFVIAYFFYYSPGVSDTGPLYYFELLLPLVVLSARGITLLHRQLAESASSSGRWRAFTPAFVIVSIALSLITFYPEKAIHIANLTEKVREPYERLKEAEVKNALVFVESLPLAGWVFGYRHNAPLFDGDVIFARSCSVEKDIEIMHKFPKRTYYYLYYDADAGKSVVVSASEEMLRDFFRTRPPEPESPREAR